MGLPREVIAEAYAFARTHDTVLREIPCYCGCQRSGHRAVLDCFVLRLDPNGRVVWSDHAMSCQVCVEVVRDALMMSRQGLSPIEIRVAMDKKYLPVLGTSTHDGH